MRQLLTLFLVFVANAAQATPDTKQQDQDNRIPLVDITPTTKPPTRRQHLGTDDAPIVVKSIEGEKTKARLLRENEQDREKDAREERNAFWASVAAIAALIACVIASFQLLMFRRQLRLARDEFNASHRPWVKFDVELTTPTLTDLSAIKLDDNHLYATLKFKLTNTGTAPALNVLPEWRLVLDGHTRDHWIEAQRKICDEVKRRPVSKYTSGMTIFPGDETEISITTNLSRQEIDHAIANGPFPDSPIKTIIISAIGCINYRSATNLAFHQTGFAYYIGATTADSGKIFLGGAMLPVQAEPIPLADLRLTKNLFDGHLFFAD